jgi:coenzyme F420-0:L-glutamate ligase/coenzyme F420-1:gamma-L-glutamate ligase
MGHVQEDLIIFSVPGIPLVNQGDDLGQIIYDRIICHRKNLEDGDVVVVAQKIISKAEGAVVRLGDVTPSEFAQRLAQQTGRDPRLCQLYIDESSEIIRVTGRMVITRHRFGFQCSSAGVDRSNLAPHEAGVALLLPRDPDLSAARLRARLEELSRAKLAVIISDSFGRSERHGSIGTAIGIAGIRHMEERVERDLFGNPSNTKIALVDELAAGASVLMGESAEGRPVVVVRGAHYTFDDGASIKPLLQ